MGTLWSKLKKAKAANVGEAAPDFTLTGASGNALTLGDLRGRKRALLIFYPQDMTSGWTDQLSAVRETIADFRSLDTEPYGVNEADAASHQAFIDQLGLPFDLLVDEGFTVSAAYDALKPEGNRIQRTVVIVGKDGKVLFRAQGAPPPEELLAAIRAAKDA